ncbi:cytochrome P450 2C31-like [Mytilus trossulus]|uniref:cytochrome P450 2C31-like n=1 Tax=Mytilus trossulus TaxID=6551 RepID=UPI00300404D4
MPHLQKSQFHEQLATMLNFIDTLGYLNSTLLISIILVVLLWIRSRRPAHYPPGPTPFPIIGNFHTLVKGDLFKVMRGLRKEYGDIFSLSLGKQWVTVVNGNENLRELLVKRADVTTDRPSCFVFRQGKNKGIVSASGSSWKQQRAFAVSKLRDFGFGKRSFESSVSEEVEQLCNLVNSFNGKSFDISGIIHTSISNNVMSITVGRRFDYDDPKFQQFVYLLNENAKNSALVGPLNFAPFLRKIPGDPFGAKQISNNVRETFKFFRTEINEHEKTLDTDNLRDFIDIYLKEIKNQEEEENSEFTAGQLLTIMADLFVAGTETTATTIRWAIMYLLNNMDIQKKMHKEIEDVIGSGRPPCMSDKPNLPYCEAVILESLRLGNVVPYALPHKASDDIVYKGFTIPKDSIILPSLDSVAFDENLFPDAHSFKPERFIDENGRLCGQDKVLSFSLGRRVCLGEALARMELFLYITSLVQRFEFLPQEGNNPPAIKGNLGVTYCPEAFEFRAVSRS